MSKYIEEEDMGAPPTKEGEPQRVPLLEHWKTLADLDVFDTPPPRREWLLSRVAQDQTIVGVLPLGKVGMLVAQGGAGKTIALCQLALSVAASPDKQETDTAQAKRERMRLAWLGFLRCDSPGRVLLALGEEDLEEVKRRMYNAAKGLTPEDRKRAAARIVVLPLAGVPCAFVEGDGKGNVTETDALRALRAKLAEEATKGDPFRLVLLDPLSRWAGADTEKDNSAATRFVQAAETLASKKYGDGNHGPTVLIAHHIPKAAKGNKATSEVSARGVSGLTDGVRWETRLSVRPRWAKKNAPPVDVLAFEVTKSNYSAPWGEETLLEKRSGHDGATLHALTPDQVEEYKSDLREYEAENKRATSAAKKKAETRQNGEATNGNDDDFG